MGAQWIAGQLRGSSWAKNIRVREDVLFQGEFLGSPSNNWRMETIFVPPPQDYIITLATLDEAIQDGATMIVGDAWTNIVTEQVSRQGKILKLFRVGDFLRTYGR